MFFIVICNRGVAFFVVTVSLLMLLLSTISCYLIVVEAIDGFFFFAAVSFGVRCHSLVVRRPSEPPPLPPLLLLGAASFIYTCRKTITSSCTRSATAGVWTTRNGRESVKLDPFTKRHTTQRR